MIIHKLIGHHLKHRDDSDFYVLQARDAIRWIRSKGGSVGGGVRALDLGCGHGVFGVELAKFGCDVTYADEQNSLSAEIQGANFFRVNLDQDDIPSLGEYDLVVCSNVLEHLARPERFLASAHRLLSSKGTLFLSWTNWLSPWGGHEFSPFHYLGSHRGHLIYDRLTGKQRKHTPHENLFPTYIGQILMVIRQSPTLRVLAVAPRYYAELGFLMALPVLREFLAWNCAMLIGRKA